jgi:hypothetical protein
MIDERNIKMEEWCNAQHNHHVVTAVLARRTMATELTSSSFIQGKHLTKYNERQIIHRRPLAAKARVRSQASPGGICGVQSGMKEAFLPVLLFYPFSIIPSMLHDSSTYYFYQKDKRAKHSSLLKKQ